MAETTKASSLGLSEEKLKQIEEEFAAIDADGDGEVSAEELWKYLEGTVDYDDVIDIVKAQDKDGNGKVSLAEFIENERSASA